MKNSAAPFAPSLLPHDPLSEKVDASSTNQAGHISYRPDIDGLRAFAVLVVVCYHAFPNLLPGGFVGVDIFFVISGFLISSIIFKELKAGSSFDFLAFYVRRIRRIFPALIAVLVSVFSLGWLVLMPDEFKQLGKHIAGSAGFISNLMLWEEAGYFDNAAELKPLLHLWSLGVEEQFYLIWPVVLVMAWKRSFSLLSFLMLAVGLSFLSSLMEVRSNSVAAFFSPLYRFWELGAGGVLAYVSVYRRDFMAGLCAWLDARLDRLINHSGRPHDGSTLRDVQSFVGAGLLLIAVTTVSKERLFPGGWALLPVLGACLVINAGATAWFNRVVLARRAVVVVGLISYPLYLWHWPLLSIARVVEGETPSIAIRGLLVLMSVGLAFVTYIFIERPLRFATKAKLTAIWLSLLMGVIGVVGCVTYYLDGAGFRPAIQRVTNLSEAFLWPENLNFDSKCGEEFGAVPGLDYCVHKVSTGQKIQIIGDSHANAVFPGLAKQLAGKNYDVLNFGTGGCSPFYDLQWKDQTRERCVDANNRLYSLLMQPTRGEIIFFLPRAIYPHFEMTSSRRPELTGYRPILENAMRQTLDKLAKTGKKVVFFVDVPELGFDTKSCVDFRPLKITSKSKRVPCALARGDFDKQAHDYHEIVESVLADYPQVTRFDAWKYFCDDEWCYGMRDQKVLYRDSGHLSQDGSDYLAQMFVRDMLNSVLVK